MSVASVEPQEVWLRGGSPWETYSVGPAIASIPLDSVRGIVESVADHMGIEQIGLEAGEADQLRTDIARLLWRAASDILEHEKAGLRPVKELSLIGLSMRELWVLLKRAQLDLERHLEEGLRPRAFTVWVVPTFAEALETFGGPSTDVSNMLRIIADLLVIVSANEAWGADTPEGRLRKEVGGRLAYSNDPGKLCSKLLTLSWHAACTPGVMYDDLAIGLAKTKDQQEKLSTFFPDSFTFEAASRSFRCGLFTSEVSKLMVAALPELYGGSEWSGVDVLRSVIGDQRQASPPFDESGFRSFLIDGASPKDWDGKELSSRVSALVADLKE